MNKNRLYSAAITVVLAMLLTGSSFGQIKENAPANLVIGASQAIVGSWYITVTSDTSPVPFRGMVTFL